MNRIKNILTESEPFQSLFRALRGITTSQPIAVTGISGSLLAFTAAGIFESRGKQTVLLVPDKDRAEQLRDDCSILLGERSVHLYASAQAHRSVQLDISAPIAQVEALRALSRKETILLIASVEALTGKIPPQKDFSSRTIDISVQNEYRSKNCLNALTSLVLRKRTSSKSTAIMRSAEALSIFFLLSENIRSVLSSGETPSNRYESSTRSHSARFANCSLQVLLLISTQVN